MFYELEGSRGVLLCGVSLVLEVLHVTHTEFGILR